jgi:hypothetical protein
MREIITFSQMLLEATGATVSGGTVSGATVSGVTASGVTASTPTNPGLTASVGAVNKGAQSDEKDDSDLESRVTNLLNILLSEFFNSIGKRKIYKYTLIRIYREMISNLKQINANTEQILDKLKNKLGIKEEPIYLYDKTSVKKFETTDSNIEYTVKNLLNIFLSDFFEILINRSKFKQKNKDKGKSVKVPIFKSIAMRIYREIRGNTRKILGEIDTKEEENDVKNIINNFKRKVGINPSEKPIYINKTVETPSVSAGEKRSAQAQSATSAARKGSDSISGGETWIASKRGKDKELIKIPENALYYFAKYIGKNKVEIDNKPEDKNEGTKTDFPFWVFSDNETIEKAAKEKVTVGIIPSSDPKTFSQLIEEINKYSELIEEIDDSGKVIGFTGFKDLKYSVTPGELESEGRNWNIVTKIKIQKTDEKLETKSENDDNQLVDNKSVPLNEITGEKKDSFIVAKLNPKKKNELSFAPSKDKIDEILKRMDSYTKFFDKKNIEAESKSIVKFGEFNEQEYEFIPGVMTKIEGEWKVTQKCEIVKKSSNKKSGINLDKVNRAFRKFGLENTATEVDVKAAYRNLAMQYHPDKTGGDKEAQGKFKEINDANEILKKYFSSKK